MWRADVRNDGHAPMGGGFFSNMTCGIASSYVYNIHNYISISILMKLHSHFGLPEGK